MRDRIKQNIVYYDGSLVRCFCKKFLLLPILVLITLAANSYWMQWGWYQYFMANYYEVVANPNIVGADSISYPASYTLTCYYIFIGVVILMAVLNAVFDMSGLYKKINARPALTLALTAVTAAYAIFFRTLDQFYDLSKDVKIQNMLNTLFPDFWFEQGLQKLFCLALIWGFVIVGARVRSKNYDPVSAIPWKPVSAFIVSGAFALMLRIAPEMTKWSI